MFIKLSYGEVSESAVHLTSLLRPYLCFCLLLGGLLRVSFYSLWHAAHNTFWGVLAKALWWCGLPTSQTIYNHLSPCPSPWLGSVLLKEQTLFLIYTWISCVPLWAGTWCSARCGLGPSIKESTSDCSAHIVRGRTNPCTKDKAEKS